MPTRKYVPKKKTNYRRKHYARRRAANPNLVVSRSSPVPDRYFTKLKYSQLTAISYGGVTVPGIHQWRMHSLYDPDLTGGGHQPLGFDQLAVLFNRYRVYGCRYKIVFVNQETTRHFDIAVILRPNSTLSLNMETILEGAYTRKSVLGVEGSGQAIKTFTGYCPNGKVLGISKEAYRTDDANQALVNSNPTGNGPILTTVMSNQNTADTGTINVRIDLEYLCEFFDRKSLSQS